MTLADLKITLSGSFSMTWAGQAPVSFNGDRPVSLLAYLLLHRHTPVSRQELAFKLWTDSTESQARANLRNLFFTLRRTIPQADTLLAADAMTIQWRTGSCVSLDVADFDAAVEAARETDETVAKIRCLETAANLYKGDLLPGNYEDWIIPLREEYRQRYLEILHELVALLEQQQDYRSAGRYCQRLLQKDPLDETTYIQLMRLHAYSGDRAGVRRVFESCVTTLRRELDVDPGPATRLAYEQLLRHEPTAAAAAVSLDSPDPPAAVQTAGAKPRLFPVPPTPFIGRETELAHIAELLADPACRLISIIGPGGIGKTRLALETAVGHKAVFRHGVAFVDLSPINSTDLVAATIATGLGVTVSDLAPHEAQLVESVREKELLLVLDNFEHLLNAVDLLARILTTAPQIKLLVTSRQRLELAEEWLFDLPGLPLPGEDAALRENSAIALFVQSAQRINRGFTLTEDDEAAVIRICRLVGGIPLGLQLAATWVRLLSCAEIAAEIERDLDFLSSSQRHLPERQRSLRTVFDYSWQLLTPAEQLVCCRLANFRGGFTREAAEEAAGGSLLILSSLVDKSLINRGRNGRYQMHELVRQYALEQAAIDETAFRQTQLDQARYFLDLLKRANVELEGADSMHWFARLDAEIDNFRAILTWSQQVGERELGLRLASALRIYWWWRGYLREGLSWLQTFQTKDGYPSVPQALKPGLLATSYIDSGILRGNLGDFSAAQGDFQRSLKFFTESDNRYGIARAYYGLAFAALYQGRIADAITYSRQSLTFYQGLDNASGLIAVYLNLGNTYLFDGDYPEALAALDEGISRARETGHIIGLAWSLGVKGEVLRRLGRYEAAGLNLEEGKTLLHPLNNTHGLAANLYYRGRLALDTGEIPLALTCFRESLRLHREIHDVANIAYTLDGLAGVASHVSRPDIATRLAGSAAGIRRQIKICLPRADREEIDGRLSAQRTLLGEDGFQQAWQAGACQSPDQALNLALSAAEELDTNAQLAQ